MRNLFLFGAAVVAIVSAMPAAAADQAGLRCIGDELGRDFVAAQVTGISSALIAGAAEIPPIPDAPLDAAVKTCTTRNSWSAKASGLARVLTSLAILRGAVERVVRADGQNTDQLGAIYTALPEATRRGFIDKSQMQEASMLAAQRLIAAKINLEGKRGEHIGMYFGALAGAEFLTPMFVAA